MEVTLDLDTANPDLMISDDDKRMRCGFERKEVPNYHQRFDGWWCAVGVEGFSSGRRYWEVEVKCMCGCVLVCDCTSVCFKEALLCWPRMHAC